MQVASAAVDVKMSTSAWRSNVVEDRVLNTEERLARRSDFECVTHETGAAQIQTELLGHSASLLRYPIQGGRGNAQSRAQLLLNMQRTHGNRAVQRAHRIGGTSGNIAVQRSMYQEMYANLEKQFDKDNPALEAHKWMLAMPQGQAARNGPFANAGQNAAGGYGFEVGASRRVDPRDGSTQDGAYLEGTALAWDEEDGGTQYGLKGNAGLYRLRTANGGTDPGAELTGADMFTAGAELSAGENGFRAQLGASAGGLQGTMGAFDKERSHDHLIRGGLDYGLSAGLRGHWADSDKDGNREYGLGIDFGPVSFDIKTEDPLELGKWFVGAGGGLPNNVEEMLEKAQQKQNQANFISNRDKELAELEKNKEQIMKEQGPQAYYQQMFLANSPPDVRSILESAAPTQQATPTLAPAPQVVPPSPQDQSLEFMTQMHEMMAAQRQ
jgi:hypothetical protein